MNLADGGSMTFDGKLLEGDLSSLFPRIPPVSECRMEFPNGDYYLFDAIPTLKPDGVTAEMLVVGAVLEGNIYDKEGSD